MTFPLALDTAPMEAKLVDRLPSGQGWQFEPKWDGFRCLAFRAGDQVELMAKSGKSLSRYFPELRGVLAALDCDRFVLDGELVIPLGENLSFDALQMRLHPADSRIRRLAAETPARFVLFDCLALGPTHLIEAPLAERRHALEAFAAALPDRRSLRLSPATPDAATAEGWLDQARGALDGVVAKRLGSPYRPGRRDMLKVKRLRTADCVVGGFRYGRGTRLVGSLLLGLHNAAGQLDHVGFTSAISDAERPVLTRELEKIVAPPGFTGDAPGKPSRWSTPESTAWEPLRPLLVAEVRYDQVTGGRFRHGTGFLRWRPDKAPAQCTFEQIAPDSPPDLLVSTVLSAAGQGTDEGMRL